MKHPFRWVLQKIQWYRECRRLEKEALGKPLYEFDGITPQKDRAALYIHQCGTLEGYPPPDVDNDERAPNLPP